LEDGFVGVLLGVLQRTERETGGKLRERIEIRVFLKGD